MNYKDYQNARDAAWRILLDCKINRLPVDLNIIFKSLEIRTAPYQAAAKLIHNRGLTEIAGKTHGMTFYADAVPVVLYDESCTPGRVCFTVAHELGHIVLGHVQGETVTRRNQDPAPGDASEETAANQFAARLLAPACVLWALNVHTPEEIVERCHVSRQAAEFRAKRLEELYVRGKFLASPLERSLYQQFLPFIRG